MINNKIKSVLSLFGNTMTKYAEYMGMSKASLSNKAARESWTAADLIQLAELSECKLAIINKEERPVMIFNQEDIKKAPASNE